jgi:hypothetical protein
MDLETIHEDYLEKLSGTDTESENMKDRIIDKLEDADGHYELSFIANDEVIAKVSGYDIDSVLEQSHKIKDADYDWAESELEGQDADPEPY